MQTGEAETRKLTFVNGDAGAQLYASKILSNRRGRSASLTIVSLSLTRDSRLVVLTLRPRVEGISPRPRPRPRPRLEAASYEATAKVCVVDVDTCVCDREEGNTVSVECDDQ